MLLMLTTLLEGKGGGREQHMRIHSCLPLVGEDVKHLASGRPITYYSFCFVSIILLKFNHSISLRVCVEKEPYKERSQDVVCSLRAQVTGFFLSNETCCTSSKCRSQIYACTFPSI